MRHLDLFAGIGGFSLAARWMGWETVAQVEWDAWCQKVLAKNFPDALRFGDIVEFNNKLENGEDITYSESGKSGQSQTRDGGQDISGRSEETYGKLFIGRIDIITGGFPCQPFSHAGKRKGVSDERYLWPEMLRTIRILKPSFVVGENVAGLVSMDNGKTLDSILADLENEGYEVESFIIPACAVGAWHRRDRIWIIAHIDSAGFKQGYQKNERKSSEQFNSNNIQQSITDINNEGLQRRLQRRKFNQERREKQENGCSTKRSVRGGRERRNTAAN